LGFAGERTRLGATRVPLSGVETVQIVEDVGEVLVAQFAQLHPTAVPRAHLSQHFVLVGRLGPLRSQCVDHPFHVRALLSLAASIRGHY
jgi:hypothetical protein